MTPRRRRPNTSLRRSTGTRPELRTIVVFCEGSETEPSYVRGLKQLPEIARRTSLRVEIAREYSVPLPLVEAAIARRSREEIDEVWCVFDVESPRPHPNLLEAIRLADKHGVHVAISNPCFEIWLVLHHKDWNKPGTTTREAEAAANGCPGVHGKSLDVTALLSLRRDAARRARALEARHAEDGKPFPHDNPSSSVYRLVESIERTDL